MSFLPSNLIIKINLRVNLNAFASIRMQCFFFCERFVAMLCLYAYAIATVTLMCSHWKRERTASNNNNTIHNQQQQQQRIQEAIRFDRKLID